MLKWRIIAITASLVPLIIIALLLNVGPQDILEVGVLPFAIASAAAITKLFVQGIRFHYFVRSFVGRVTTAKSNIFARVGSEFLNLTTPAYIGGEFLRVAWLYKHGVSSGKGMWIITVEVISDVLVGSVLAYIAAAWAFLAGNYLIAFGILAITSPIFGTYMILLVMSSKKIFQIPKFSQPLIGKFMGPARALKIVNTCNDALGGLCQMARENLNSLSLKIFVVGFALTFLGAAIHAVTFMVLANTIVGIGFFESLMAVAASISIGTLPISPGGSGTSEFGIGAYLPTFGLDPVSFGSIIIAWRIASYHIILILSWIVLMKMAVSRGSIMKPPS